MISPKTTTLGVLGLVTLLGNVGVMLLDGDPLTNPDWSLVVPSVMALLGSLFARDNK